MHNLKTSLSPGREATTETLIIGAGPYGIAVALELTERGAEFQIVGEPFALWHEHTLNSMKMRSDRRTSEIYSARSLFSFEDYLEVQEGGSRQGQVGIATFRSYLEQVTENLPFRIVRRQVTHLEQQEGGFAATLDDGGQIAARSVVIATGPGPHRNLPEAVRQLPEEQVLHSWDTRAIERLEGRRVLVVGAGQSAAETVAHLRSNNEVTWLLRREPFFFREPLRLPTPLFHVAMAFSRGLFSLPPILLRTVAKAVFRTTITPDLEPIYHDKEVRKVFASLEDLELAADSDGSIRANSGQSFDVVVAATGYRYSLAGVPFLSPSLVAELGGPQRAPKLDSNFETSVSGLFMTGGIAEASYGPAMRFIVGSRHAARRLGDALSGRRSSRWQAAAAL